MEKGQLLLFILPLWIGTALGLFLALYLVRNSLVRNHRALFILILGATLWSCAYALELSSPDLETKLFWARIQYFGITTVPLAWYLFSIEYISIPAWVERWPQLRTLLWSIPVLTLCLVWTNDAHGLIWRQVQLKSGTLFPIMAVEHGLWFWIYLIFGYSIMLYGTVKLVLGSMVSVRHHRWQIGLMILAALFPWLGNLSYVSRLNPIPDIDWTPFAFTLAGLLFTISLFRFRLVKLLPIAQRAVFQRLADCVLVLDLQNCIVDLNTSAQAMIGETGKGALGKPLDQIFPELMPWIAQAGFSEELQVEISLGEQPNQHYYYLHISPLAGPYLQPIGRLVSLRDITPLKQEQVRLEQSRSELERTVDERTGILQQTIEQLQHELSQRSLAEKRFERVIELAPDGMIILNTQAEIVLVNKRAEELFGYPCAELVGGSLWKLFPHERQPQDHHPLMQYITNPTTRTMGVGLDVVAIRKDGSEFQAALSMGALQTENGYWVVCNVRDISERIKAHRAQQRLLEEIKQSQAQLRVLTIRLQKVQEIERRQIATELHDRVGQNLTGLNLNLHLIQNRMPADAPEEILTRLRDSLKLIEETTRQVREVMADLHPLVLEENGLISALQWYGDNFSQRTGITTRVTGEEIIPRLNSNVEMVLFRLVQEALINAAKHAHASKVTITVESNSEVVSIKVRDNGQGFDTKELETPDGQPHYGLVHMRQRAASIGGELVIDTAPGAGTEIAIRAWRRTFDD